MADFSNLPEVTWVKIMQCLDLADRGSVSRTCHALNNVFCHPSLWNKVSVALLGNVDGYSFSTTVTGLLQHFGPYIQDLTFAFTGLNMSLDDQISGLITDLSKECRLLSLTLDVGIVRSKHDWAVSDSFKALATKYLNTVLLLVTHAYRLQTFNLKSWPQKDQLQDCGVLDALINNPKITKLKSLRLYWVDAMASTWATINGGYPTPDQVTQTVSHFTHLEELYLRSVMVNEAVITALAQPRRVQLKRLGIIVSSCRSNDEHTMEHIHDKAWKTLVDKNPDLKSEIILVNRIKYIQLCEILKPSIPVVSIQVMKHSRFGPEDIYSVQEKYNRTLTKLQVLADSNDTDSALIDLVTKCDNLSNLFYCGSLVYSTVEQLAQIKGQNWDYFQINIDNVATVAEEEEDPNNVLGRNERGEVYILRVASAYQSEEEKENILKTMTSNVESALCRAWSPVNRMILERLLK